MEWTDLLNPSSLLVLVLAILSAYKHGKYRRIIRALILGIEEAGHKETKAGVAGAAFFLNVTKVLDKEIGKVTGRSTNRQHLNEITGYLPLKKNRKGGKGDEENSCCFRHPPRIP